MFKRIHTLFIIIIMGALNSIAQLADPVKITISEKINEQGQLELCLKGVVEDGWHIYGANFEDGGPQRATITLEKQDGVKAIGTLQTIGNVHRGTDPMFGMEVETIEGEVTFVQTYELTQQAYEISGYFTYGACNDQNCIPPTSVDFAFKGNNPNGTATSKQSATDNANIIPATEILDIATTANPETANDLWAPVTDLLQSNDDVSSQSNSSLPWIFLMGMVGGLLALLTPCVWPIIPMTVSFFLKRSKDNRRKGIQDAITYGISIIVIYVGLGMLVTLFFE